MDLATQLDALPIVGHYFAIVVPYAAAVVALAAFVARLTPPPSNPTGWYAKFYYVLNQIAQNAGHAANASPANDPPKS